jgi:glycine/D-amino acid oxidase-like deaminating enzyme
MSDFAVIGGGIVGCALAAFLAEGGAEVTQYEREEVAAGASGRNSGVLQHPFDDALVGLYEESLRHYAQLDGFALPPEPSGLLIVSRGELTAERFPELEPQLLDDAREAEPELAPGLRAVRYETGRPVPPAAATEAFAARARRAGAKLEIAEARVAIEDGEATGVIVEREHRPAKAVAVAAGPWTPEALGTGWVPISPLWGVVVEVRLERPPRHTLEESGIDALTEGASGTLFSIVTAQGLSAVGSTFLPEKPDPREWIPRLLERGVDFLPALDGTKPRGLRVCARPASSDGRPLLGPIGIENLAIASGHGAWGVSLGPASARLVADGLLGRAAEIPEALAAARLLRGRGLPGRARPA